MNILNTSSLHDENPLMKNDRLLSVVILSYNRSDVLIRNVELLCVECEEQMAAGGMSVEVIVVDNASTDDSLIKLAPLQRYPFLRVIANASNLGVAEGRNTGYRLCQGQYILNLDDDAQLDLASIMRMVDIIDSDDSIGIVSPAVKHARTGDFQFYCGQTMMEVANFHGACHLFRFSVFQAIGYLDPLCVFGGEELDFSIRCRNRGFKVVYEPSLVALHDSYIREGMELEWRRRQWVYNFTRIFFKHFQLKMSLALAFRYLLSNVANGMRSRGVFFALSLVIEAFRGAFHGWTVRSPINPHARAFYERRDLVPEFGNVPLTIKVKRWLLKSSRVFEA